MVACTNLVAGAYCVAEAVSDKLTELETRARCKVLGQLPGHGSCGDSWLSVFIIMAAGLTMGALQ